MAICVNPTLFCLPHIWCFMVLSVSAQLQKGYTRGTQYASTDAEHCDADTEHGEDSVGFYRNIKLALTFSMS